MKLHADILRKQNSFTLEVDLSLETDFTVLFGHSGSGKSTLMECISGMRQPDRGLIELEGDIFFSSEKGRSMPLERRGLGCVCQDVLLFPNMTVSANLQYGHRLRGGSIRPGDIADVLGIAHLLKRHPVELSGGEARRVAIGRALCSNPRLLLVDEPLVSLDLASCIQIAEYLEMVNREFRIPIIYVTHHIEEVRTIAADVVIMESGWIKGRGHPSEIFGK